MKSIVVKVLLIMIGISVGSRAEVIRQEWGHTSDGTSVEIYTLRSKHLEVRAMGYGARLVSIRSYDKNGKMSDVILGYDSLPEYLTDQRTHFGAVVGRFGNRIAGGRFSIDGQKYQVPVNNGPNALHGGTVGFDQKVWQGSEVPGGVEFTVVSHDGDMGFPGTLTAKVRYTLQNDVLRIDYAAMTDKPTVLNLTNHAYFNLGGNEGESILSERLMVNADLYTPVDAQLIPTGQIATVAGTPLDFRNEMVIGSRISEPNQQLLRAGGYDHNFVLAGRPGELNLAARLYDPQSGRQLTVMTTEPGVQFYSGNKLDGTFLGRTGKPYVQHSGLCLETQHFPNSPNEPGFPTTLLKPGEHFKSTTTLRFTVQRP